MTSDHTRRQFLKASLGTAFAVSASGLLVACGDDDETSGSGQGGGSGDLSPLSVLMPFPIILNFIGDCVGVSGGYMADQGVDMTLDFARTAPQATQQLAAGSVQLIRTAPIAIASAVSNEDAPFVSIGMPVQKIVYVLVSSPDDPVDSLEDLEGKTIGLPQLASNAEDTLNLVLNSAGIDPESVSREAVGVEATSFALVEEGRVDVIWATREAAAGMEASGFDIHVAEVEDANPLLGVSLCTTRDALDANRDTMVNYLVGLRDSFEAVRDPETFEALIPQLLEDWDLPQLEDPEAVMPIIAAISDMWYAEGEENVLRNIPESWEQGVAEFQRLGIVPEDASATDFYVSDLWDEAFA